MKQHWCKMWPLLLVLGGCDQLKDFAPTLDGALGVSDSIQEARTRGVFLSQYRPAVTEFDAAGGHFRIRECWVEKSWQHVGVWASNTRIDQEPGAGFGFVIQMTEPNEKLWDVQARMVNDPNRGLEGHREGLWTGFREMPPDTLSYRLMLNDSTPSDVILRFYKQAQ
ncbi:hypothetical protein LJ737_11485 [Hymenobacter sp. 15J16-1T3B]|uniref:hypothetical protein n=1 Tax=Hymenobacter sp. 15J16-1T3B TaxID=2886941 RepID=UPI001D10361F|nr:hypothetical protein [Hymenobacter sp. 15J16-1T3B]MCC3157862.1 hypothetical protein [Hymenobacter sp. 15J16-1T3B]